MRDSTAIRQKAAYFMLKKAQKSPQTRHSNFLNTEFTAVNEDLKNLCNDVSGIF